MRLASHVTRGYPATVEPNASNVLGRMISLVRPPVPSRAVSVCPAMNLLNKGARSFGSDIAARTRKRGLSYDRSELHMNRLTDRKPFRSWSMSVWFAWKRAQYPKDLGFRSITHAKFPTFPPIFDDELRLSYLT